MYKPLALLLAVSVLLSVFVGFPVSVSAADADYIIFDEGAVLLDGSYSGKNVLIQNGVFSVTVSGATNVNIIFESVTMDRRYASDTNDGVTVTNLYKVATTLDWRSGSTYYAQTCPLLLTNNASATVAFRGTNEFYAGTNRCTVRSTNGTDGSYTKVQNGGGFAGIQVDSGSTLTIEPSGGTIKAHGGFWVDTDNSNNVPDSTHYENDGNGYGWPFGAKTNLSGGAGIGGGGRGIRQRMLYPAIPTELREPSSSTAETLRLMAGIRRRASAAASTARRHRPLLPSTAEMSMLTVEDGQPVSETATHSRTTTQISTKTNILLTLTAEP